MKPRRLALEPLEQRTLLAGGMIELGPSDNVALDQPRVAIELLQSTGPGPNDWGSVGPSMFNTLLLDTGANSILAMATAVNDLVDPPYPYQTQGTFLEAGVAGDHELDISVAYRFDFAGTSGIRNTIDNARILSDPDNDFSMLGPWGLVGMPAMVDRVTSIDMSGWSAGGSLMDLYMRVDFSPNVPDERDDPADPDPGHRYTVPVDNRIQFDPVAQTLNGLPPVWGDVPFLDAYPTSNGLSLKGNFLFDTGAQMSVISKKLAIDLGLDSNGNGTLDDEAIRFETVGGVGGTVSAPVLFIDELRVPTEEGVDLVWTDLQWLALDIELPGTEMTLDGVFGSDLLTSGWVEALFSGAKDGYFQQVHFDFRTMDDDGTGTILFDLTPGVDQVIPPGPGVRIWESLGYTEVLEGGTEDDYRLVLTEQPTEDVTIAFAPLNGEISVEEDGVPGSQSVTFTSLNWNVPQTIRVTATNDNAAEGSHTSRIIHTISSADPDYDGIPVRYVDVNILDDDLSLLIIEQTDDSTDVTEGGANDTFTVQLASEPNPLMIVEIVDNSLQTVISGGPVLPNYLTFTFNDWNVPQTITVTADDDSLLEGPHQASLTLIVYDASSTAVGQSTLTVNIEDNDVGAVAFSQTAGSTDVSEDGTGDTYTMVLAKSPTDDVTINLEDAAGQVTAVDDANPANEFLLFRPDNWDTPQTVRVSAVDDEMAEGSQISRIAHNATSNDPAFDGLAIPDMQVTIEANDTAGVLITETDGSTEVAENGAADTYSIVLTSQPTADVQLHLQTGDQIVAVDQANPANAFVVFTPSNWNVAQDVRITAINDAVAEGTVDVSVAHDAMSTDGNYRGTHNLTVRIVDDDTPGVTIDQFDGNIQVTEGGATDTYSVVLDSQPTHNVQIDLSDAAGQLLVVDDSNPGNTFLVFDSSNWDTAQTVRVSAVDDNVKEGLHNAAVDHTVTSADSNYSGIAVDGVVVAIIDNDNRPPVAEGDTYFTDVDSSIWPSVLDNDDDANGDSLSAVLVTGTSHGTVVLAADGLLEYTPDGGYFGPDSFTYTANDGELDSNLATVTINVVRPLGPILSTIVPGLDVSHGPHWMRLESSRAGFLSAKAYGNVQLHLYDQSPNDPPVATSSLVRGAQRIDLVSGAAGESYYLKISGSSDNVDLRLTNLVEKTGTDVTVHGTDAEDTFEFDASGPPSITVNAMDYAFASDQVTRTTFAGGPGDDQAIFHGSSGTETAILYNGYGTFKDGSRYQNGAWSVDVSEVESITAHAGIGSRDEAFLYDSPGSDTFEAWPFHGTLSGDGYSLETFEFVYTHGYATTPDGGQDLAVLHDSARNDKIKLYQSKPGQHFVKMYRGDYNIRAKMFETVQADFSDGDDLARLFGSTGNDTLIAQRDTSRMHGPGFDVTVTGYDKLIGYAETGSDVAHFMDSPADDVVRARGHKTMMWSGSYLDPDYMLMARRFDEVHASAAGFEDDLDKAKLHDTAGDNHLEAEYLSNDLSRAALFKLSGTQLKMLYEVLAFDQVNSYRTTGNDTKDITPEAEDFLMLRDGW